MTTTEASNNFPPEAAVEGEGEGEEVEVEGDTILAVFSFLNWSLLIPFLLDGGIGTVYDRSSGNRILNNIWNAKIRIRTIGI